MSRSTVFIYIYIVTWSENETLFSLYILSLILVEESDYIPSLLPPFFQHFQIPIEKQKSSEGSIEEGASLFKVAAKGVHQEEDSGYAGLDLQRAASSSLNLEGVGMNEGVNKEAKGFVIH